MKTRIAWPLLVLAAVGLAAGCGSDDSGSGAEGDGESATTEKIVVGYSNPSGSDVSLQSIGYGAKEAIEKLELPWTVREVDAKLSADKQVSDIDTLITQQAGGIVSWTLNSGAMEPAYARAKEAGIPVIGLNSESPSISTNIKSETDSTCNVAEDQAKYIAERIPQAKVVMIEGPEIPTVTFTNNCFREGAEAEGLEIIDSAVDTAGTPANGQKVAEALLAKNKAQVQTLWAWSDHSGEGVSAAAQDAGLKTWTEDDPSGVIVISRDGVAAAIDNIKRGILTATWDANFGELGAAAVQLLQQHYVDDVPLDELPKEIVIEATRYDGTNAGDYVSVLERDVPLPIE